MNYKIQEGKHYQSEDGTVILAAKQKEMPSVTFIGTCVKSGNKEDFVGEYGDYWKASVFEEIDSSSIILL